MTADETHVWFPSGALRLEGRLQRRAGTRGAIVCHPHPLYGGDMHSPVVTTVAGAFAAAGFSVLRFNFRGTGASEGRYGKGIDERDDALDAVSFLQREAGANEVWLAGYSFGAFVIAQLPQRDLPPGQRVLIAPPVSVMDFSSVQRIDLSPITVEAARKNVAARGLDARIELLHMDGGEHEPDRGAMLDLASCVGASWIYERHKGTLEAMARMGLQWQAAERYAATHPDDPDVEPLLQTARENRDASLRWGRDCLGWAMYLFRSPRGSSRC